VKCSALSMTVQRMSPERGRDKRIGCRGAPTSRHRVFSRTTPKEEFEPCMNR